MPCPWTDPTDQPAAPDCPDPAEPPRRPGQPYWSSLLGGWIDETTQPLPLVDRPLMTPAAEWRSRGGAR